MLKAGWDKHTITFKASETPEVFCFSPSPSSLVSSFVLFLFLYPVPSPPVSLDIHASFWVHPCSASFLHSLFRLSFPVFCSRVELIPFAYGKKPNNLRLVTWITVLLGFPPHGRKKKNGRGMTLYQDKGTRMNLSQAFCQYFFHRIRSMLTSSASSFQRRPDGNRVAPTWAKGREEERSSSCQKLK